MELVQQKGVGDHLDLKIQQHRWNTESNATKLPVNNSSVKTV